MQFVDNVSFVTGAHTAKMGVDLETVDGQTTFNPGANGIYTFNSLADFAARKPVPIPAIRRHRRRGRADHPARVLHTGRVAAAASGLTVSPGLRYEQALPARLRTRDGAGESFPARDLDPRRQGSDRAPASGSRGTPRTTAARCSAPQAVSSTRRPICPLWSSRSSATAAIRS